MSAVIPFQHPQQSKSHFAKRYAHRGLAVFPCWWVLPETDGRGHLCACGDKSCINRGKHPISKLVPLGHTMATNDAATIERWWATYPEANIGMPMAANHLIGVDIDPRNGGYLTIEQIEAQHGPLVSEVLQFSGGGGEHRIFSAPKDAAFPGKLGAGIDLKHNGYLIVEPSNHACGGSYEFEASSSILDEAPSPFPDWVKDLGRDSARSPSSAHAEPPRFFSESDMDRAASGLLAIPSDERDLWVQVGMAVHAHFGEAGFPIWDNWSRSSHKYDAKDLVRVWRSFRHKGLDGVAAGTLFKLISDHGGTAACAPDLSKPLPPVLLEQVSAESEKRSSLRNIPCRPLQAVCDWLSSVSESHHPDISVVGALALGSAITGRLYASEEDNWTALMMVVSGPSGVGKNYIQVGAERLLLAAGLERRIAGDFYTHQAAVYGALRNAPAHLCISDEFGENFYEARKNNNANKATVFKSLKRVYSSANHIFKSETYANAQDDDRKPIIKPSLSLVGLTTPLQFFSEIKTGHIEGGLMNRLIIVSVDRQDVASMPDRCGMPPEGLIEWVRLVSRHDTPLAHTAYDLEPVPVKVAFSKEARAAFAQFKADQMQRCDELEVVGLGSMPIRWRENAMKMATMLAACDNPTNPVVSGDVADWCVEYVRRRGEDAVALLSSSAGENEYQQSMNAVLAFVRQSGGEGRTLTELSLKFRSIKRNQMAEIRSHLIESALAEEISIPTAGRNSVRLVAKTGEEK